MSSEETLSSNPFVECRARLRAALGRLASSGSSEIIRASAPQELAEACGFTRAMMSAVRGSRWVPLQLYTRDELFPESTTFRSYIESDAEIPLANLLAETDMVRRRTVVLVDESRIGTRAFKPIVELSQSPAYVATPIVVEGRTIGFMHADRVEQERPVDDDDRRYIQAFGGELAVVYQCAVWVERIAERARRALNELERAKESLTLIESATVDLPVALDSPPIAARDGDNAVRKDSAFLTAREPIFPRWVGFLNLWTAVLIIPAGLVEFFKTGPFAYDGAISFWFVWIVFFGWIIGMTAITLRACTAEKRRQVADDQLSGDVSVPYERRTA
jgi:hypothetical protein